MSYAILPSKCDKNTFSCQFQENMRTSLGQLYVICNKQFFSQSNVAAKSAARILNNSPDNYQQADHSWAFSKRHKFFSGILAQKMDAP